MPSVIEFLQSQVFTEVPVPTKKFTGQTIIVTGSNTGLGFEAARHFVLLDAAKVILAVRSISRGTAAAARLEESTKTKGIVEVWELDLASYASVQSFAKKARSLERLDVLVNNAGVMTYDFVLAEKDDSLITVNAVSPLLLSMSVLPKMRETSLKYEKDTIISFVGSLGHARVDFIESKSKHIFKDLAVEKAARMTERYNISKVIQLQLARELAENVTKSEKPSEFITSDEGIKVQKQLWKELLEKLDAIAPGIVDLIGISIERH
ncbi:Short chain dehydrogenase atnD [Colletotrichum sp. SAR 10_98]|nr:Short chain dehydrogenase atnD [Colletotrichum sp. SAR 10_96]KAI8272016.1 Short chain dehydrogenase atnD [Colletotrichum sp. SAR 10_98]